VSRAAASAGITDEASHSAEDKVAYLAEGLTAEVFELS
jgi:hypothetical protein